MPKRGNTDQDDLFVSQKRLPLKTVGAVLALDAWEGSLRVLQGGAGQKTSLSERQKDFTAAEVERLALSAVYATDESREKLVPFEEAGLNVTTLPRALAVYWAFREQAGDEPCLVISTGGERTRCSLVVGGELFAESADNNDLSLKGIWNSHLALPSNGPTRDVYDDRRLRDETFEERAFEGFISALRTGKAANVGRFPISSPIHLDGSLGAFRALAARAVAASPVPGLQVRKVILSDWGAAHCNLHELLSADYTVLRGEPRDAFQQAVRGLISYAAAQAAEPRVERPQPAEPQPPERPPVVQPTFAPRSADASPAPPRPRAANAAESAVPVNGLAKPKVASASADAAARTRRERPVEAKPAPAPGSKAAAGGPSPGSTPAATSLLDVKPSRPASDSMWRVLVIAPILLLVIIFVWAMIPNSARSNGNGTPTPQPTVERQSDPIANAGMVLIAGGEFLMGRSDSTDPFERPPHKVPVRPYLLDAFEVTREQYALFLKEDPRAPPSGWEKRQFPVGTGKQPVTGVTWDDARAYAKWAGKRLPSEEEWEFAARGPEGRLYPWGNEWRDGVANIGRERGGGPADVGSFGGATPGGVYDLIGNVWEWTDSEMGPYPGGRLPPLPPGDLKVIRGGAWRDDTNINGTYRAYLLARGGRDYSGTGFRCAKDVPPGAGGQ